MGDIDFLRIQLERRLDALEKMQEAHSEYLGALSDSVDCLEVNLANVQKRRKYVSK